jgi:hypothetical protein
LNTAAEEEKVVRLIKYNVLFTDKFAKFGSVVGVGGGSGD